MTREGLSDLHVPAVAWVNEDHCIAALAAHGSGAAATAATRDPNDHEVRTIPMEERLRLSGGYLLPVRR